MGIFDRFKSSNNTASFAPAPSAPRFLTNTGPARTVRLRQEAAPAVDRGVVLSKGGVNLAKSFDKAGVSLSKAGLTGIRAQAVMLLDHSASMSYDYQTGDVQALVERALAFSAQIDIDGQLPIIPFDSYVHDEVEVDLNNFSDVVNRKIWYRHNMSGTKMAPAFEAVRKMAEKTDDPIFLIVIGDGDPQDQSATTKAVFELSRYPVFIKFLAIRPVAYLEQLDNHPADGRLLDNVNSQFVPNPTRISDLEFSDKMVEEWSDWVTAAKDAGVLI